MNNNNRFRFDEQDLNRITFEHELNAQNISFRVEEHIDSHAIDSRGSNGPQFIYIVAEKDFPAAYKVFDKIAEESDFLETRMPAMWAYIGLFLIVVLFIWGIRFM
ncbi:MAG: hypothetical protein GY810_27065 [Aureispira sp.]|nr:hypothetical protein [Aureispira sp.]